MRISSVCINNFKSLIDFEINLPHFTCLVGLNGAGKSTVLQAIDFLSQLMKGHMDEWFFDRGWDIKDIKFKLEEKQNKQVRFKVVFSLDDGTELLWNGLFSQTQRRCTSEEISHFQSGGDKHILFEVKDKKYRITKSLNETHSQSELNKMATIDFEYSGSILSQLSDKLIVEVPLIEEIKKYMINTKSLDLLSPYTLKANSRAAGDIGLGGERFPSFLKEFKNENERSKLIKDMQLFYPQLKDFKIIGQRGGVKKIVFIEDCGEKGLIEFDAKHINDGIVRVLAIIAQTQKQRSLILFDEIENGINPELIRALMLYLIKSPAQVIVTTHSPMILNYIPMNDATDSIVFLYKKNGETKAEKFLSLEQTQWKTDILGPGEIYVDTDLVELSTDLAFSDGPRSAVGGPSK